MRPRNQALLGLGLFVVLVVIAAVLGRRGARRPNLDQRTSSFLSGPGGVRGLADALRRLGIGVRRFRGRPVELSGLPVVPREALAVLDPTFPLSPPEVDQISGFLRTSAARNRGGDLILAGGGAEAVMRCFGYRLSRPRFDSAPVLPPGQPLGPEPAWVHRTLVATHETVAADSTRASDIGVFRCAVPTPAIAETLLVTPGRRVAALRLRPEGSLGWVTLVSDENLIRNRTLRRTDAGPLVLGWLAGRYDRVIFEEYHHGFGASGSLAGSVLEWSARTPWGWAVWQAAAVSVLALLFGAIRFGPARSGIERRRRSPLEHVRALARALSAARGHDMAIAALVRGLRRRVVPPAIRARGDAAAWLGQLDGSLLSPRGRESLDGLRSLTRPGQPSVGVLRAANAVEDLWEELRP
jgi:hypothetical protein